MFLYVAKAVLFELAAKPTVNVLHDAQGTDDAAIDSAEKKGDNNKDGHHDGGQGKNSRNKLDFGCPAYPLADAVAGSYKEQGDGKDHDDGEGDAELS